eukprot:scaffold148093_cov31-Attheya_sp.AAC.1
MKLQDAAMEQAQEADQVDATRLSILKHIIYMPCQEEVETLVPAGVAMLNKIVADRRGLKISRQSTPTLPLPSYQPNAILPYRWSTDSCRKCRTVAKEARIVIGHNYGVESVELQAFEEVDSLQPVVRPDSAEREFIQGLQYTN